MDKFRNLRDTFEATPFVQFLGMTVDELEEKRARVTLPIRQEFTTHHGRGLVGGHFLFAAANTAGVYAAMTRIEDGEEALLSTIGGGSYREAVLLEEGFVSAEARVVRDRKHVDARGKERRMITSKISLRGPSGALKAQYMLRYSVIPRESFGRAVQRIITKRA